MLNIPSTRDDPNFRYKMPRLIAKVEGRGNGIKTNIVNMGDIAKALKRMPEYATKFCGTELGAQSKFDSAYGNAIVNGNHTQETLQVLIDKFIEKFVVCPSCQLPEIDIFIRKGRVSGKCNACGNVSDLDNEHKLATFIVKNPPDETSTVGKTAKKSKAERRAEKASRQAAGELGSESEDEEEEEVKEKKKKKKEKKGSEGEEGEDGEGKKKKKKKKEKGEGGESDGEDDEEGEKKKKKKKEKGVEGEAEGEEKKKKKKVREGEDADKKEKKKKEKKKKSEAEADDDAQSDAEQQTSPDGIENDEVEDLVNEMNILFAGDVELTPESFYEELRVLQVSRFFDMKTRFLVTLKVLLRDDTSLKSFQTNLPFLVRLARGTPSEEILSATCERLKESEDGYKNLPIILHLLYENDLVPEEDVTQYFSQNGSSDFEAVKVAAAPFLSWLAEADEESDEE